jgi:hypothetical protein
MRLALKPPLEVYFHPTQFQNNKQAVIFHNVSALFFLKQANSWRIRYEDEKELFTD